jgi:hypothetical protein
MFGLAAACQMVVVFKVPHMRLASSMHACARVIMWRADKLIGRCRGTHSFFWMGCILAGRRCWNMDYMLCYWRIPRKAACSWVKPGKCASW